VVVETKGLSDEEALWEYLDKAIGELQARGLVLLIENSNIYQNGRYEYGAFSEGTKLCAIVSDLTEAYHYDGIGICADMGTANLLNCNVASFVEDCLAYLTLLHFNDNDGYHDDAQMPFTFTVGRGTRSTDIYRIIGVLVKCGFDGYIVANTSGTWGRTPRALHGSMLRLLDTMLSEYKHALSIKELLVRPGKRLILFGAGRMLYDYLINLGDECPPEFVVDNNDEIWNTTLLGCKVKPPKAILDVPAEERNVFICNSHYDAIGAQLREMGVEYDCFVDQYYL
jgi:hypothetical protein